MTRPFGRPAALIGALVLVSAWAGPAQAQRVNALSGAAGGGAAAGGGMRYGGMGLGGAGRGGIAAGPRTGGPGIGAPGSVSGGVPGGTAGGAAGGGVRYGGLQPGDPRPGNPGGVAPRPDRVGGGYGGWRGDHRGPRPGRPGRGWGYYPGIGLGLGLGYGYGYGYPYYDDGYAAAGYAEDEAVEDRGAGAEQAAYCTKRFKTYDPRTGTYVGKGGRRIACP